MPKVIFDSSAADAALILLIAQRAQKLEQDAGDPGRELMTWEMDITAAHLNGNPLDLARLLAFSDFDFAHDVFGICRTLDRSTGALCDLFLPRSSLSEPLAA